jgi:hypothetical protein
MKTDNLKPAKKSGRAFNGAHRDAGTITHYVENKFDRNTTSWEKALCGTVPGHRGNGWDFGSATAVTCETCIKKFEKLTSTPPIDATTEKPDYNAILETELAKIDWKLKFAGADHYVLVNNTGKETQIVFYVDKLTIESDQVFGKHEDYASYVEFGWLSIGLKDVEFRHHEKYLNICARGIDHFFLTLKRIDEQWRQK